MAPHALETRPAKLTVVDAGAANCEFSSYVAKLDWVSKVVAVDPLLKMPNTKTNKIVGLNFAIGNVSPTTQAGKIVWPTHDFIKATNSELSSFLKVNPIRDVGLWGKYHDSLATIEKIEVETRSLESIIIEQE
jgi:hypothetical protein